jgi:hypothetical protein
MMTRQRKAKQYPDDRAAEDSCERDQRHCYGIHGPSLLLYPHRASATPAFPGMKGLVEPETLLGRRLFGTIVHQRYFWQALKYRNLQAPQVAPTSHRVPFHHALHRSRRSNSATGPTARRAVVARDQIRWLADPAAQAWLLGRSLCHDFSSRVRWLVDALACLPGMRSLVIDDELVATDAAGLPDFYRLHFHRHDHGLCVWAFDLLHYNGRDLRELPLIERKAGLERLIVAANASWLHYSESFDDGFELLTAADRLGLEGIVSKCRDAPYRSGKQSDWVKCVTWRAANKERWRLFERHRSVRN